MPPPTGVVRGPLIETRKSVAALTESSGSQFLNLAKGLFAGKNLKPFHRAFSAIGLLNSGVENALGGAPDIATGTVALDKRNDGMIGNAVLAVRILDRLAVFGQS